MTAERANDGPYRTAAQVEKDKEPMSNRPREIHKAPCKHCPSAHYPPDPESTDIKETWPREDQLQSVFPCAWRPEKQCKGYCDFLGVTEEDLKEIVWDDH